MQIDRYLVRGEIARGGFGAVYRAWDPVLQREVAIKVLLDHRDEDEVERFRREGHAVTRISHPNVLIVLGSGTSQGRPYLVMELVEGPTLTARLQTEGQLSSKEAAALVADLALGVEAAHQVGVLHRDLKPDNILFREGHPLLTDFGIARVANAHSLTQTGELLGTPSYMAPEQVEGDPTQLSPRTDVYGLGAILYAALTGSPPFEEATILATLDKVLTSTPEAPRTLRPEVDPALNALCLRALARDPAERFASAAEFAGALTEWSSASAREPALEGEGAAGLTARGLAIGSLLLVGLFAVARIALELTPLPPATPSPSPSPELSRSPLSSAPTPSPLPTLAPSPTPAASRPPVTPLRPARDPESARLLAKARATIDVNLRTAARLLAQLGKRPGCKPVARLELALVLIKLRRLDEAATLLERSEPKDSSRADLARFHYVTGRLLFERGQLERARESFERAIGFDQSSARYVAWRGIAGSSAEREAYLERARALRADDPAAVYLAYLCAGSFPKSPQTAKSLLAAFQAALKAAPASPYLQIHLTPLHWHAKDAVSALESASASLEAWPNFPATYREAGWIHVQLSNSQGEERERWLADGEKIFLTGLKEFPDDLGILRELAWLRVLQRRFQEGVEAHVRLMELEGETRSGWSRNNTYLAVRGWLNYGSQTRDVSGIRDPLATAALGLRVLTELGGAEFGDFRSRQSYGGTPQALARARAELRIQAGRVLGVQRRWSLAEQTLGLEVNSGPIPLRARFLRYLNRSERFHYTLRRDSAALAEDERELLRAGHEKGVAEILEARAIRRDPFPPTQYLSEVTAKSASIRLRYQLCLAIVADPHDLARELELRKQVVSAAPADLLAWQRLSEALLRGGRSGVLLGSLRQAPETIRTDPLIVMLAGKALSQSAREAKDGTSAQRYASAERAFASALEQEPDFAAAEVALVEYWVRRGEAKKARARLESTRGKLPPETWDSLEELVRNSEAR